jgi:uncharacterized protein YhfF
MSESKQVSPAVRALAEQLGLDLETASIWGFGDSEAMARELANLVVAGKKTATAGLVWAYEHDGDPIPRVGDIAIITDFAQREPLAVIETTEVRVGPFSSCDEAFARDEGEGDLTLPWWREAHWAFFSRECADIGREPSEDMPIVFQRFRLRYP